MAFLFNRANNNVYFAPLYGIFGFKFFTSNFNINDLFFKINPSDAPILLYYFFWINFWYLFFFFFVLFLFLNYNRFFNFTLFTTYIGSTFTIFYLYEIADHFLSTHQLLTLQPDLHELNLLLLNNLNKIHPYFFYISLIFTFLSVTTLIFLNNSINLFFKTNYGLTALSKQIWFMAQYNFWALFLGSWWALQEGTWGGWWNWDPSETFGLLFLLNALFLMHAKTSINFFNKIFFKFLVQVLTLFLFYYLIQLNFDLVSHNFGTKFFYFFNNNFFFLEFVVILLTLIVISFMCLRALFLKYLKLLGVPPLCLLSSIKFGRLFLLYALLTLFPLLSFQPLLTYFSWIFFKTNLLNFDVHFSLYSLFFIFYFLIYLTKVPLLTFRIIPLLSLISHFVVMLNFSFFSVYDFGWALHALILQFFQLNFLASQLNLSFFNVESNFFNQLFDNILFVKTKIIYLCDFFFLEFDDLYSSMSTGLSGRYSFFLWKSLNLFNFVLADGFSSCINWFSINFFFFNLIIPIELLFINLLIPVLGALIALFLFYKTKKKILFF